MAGSTDQSPEEGSGSMTIDIRAVQSGFVGEVTGIDICRPIAADEVAALERGMDEYAVLTFPTKR
jgi:alpha-ketoglutarate-dependent 2,4-dichlorophenoxyacetate dioxygenase